MFKKLLLVISSLLVSSVICAQSAVIFNSSLSKVQYFTYGFAYYIDGWKFTDPTTITINAGSFSTIKFIPAPVGSEAFLFFPVSSYETDAYGTQVSQGQFNSSKQFTDCLGPGTSGSTANVAITLSDNNSSRLITCAYSEFLNDV